jgi:hypothetical protein
MFSFQNKTGETKRKGQTMPSKEKQSGRKTCCYISASKTSCEAKNLPYTTEVQRVPTHIKHTTSKTIQPEESSMNYCKRSSTTTGDNQTPPSPV